MLASFPGSCAEEEEREPGRHCSRMRQVFYSRVGVCKVLIAGQETKRMVRDGATGVGAAAMRSMVDDVASLCLVKECR